jgi:transcriptional regulator with XRE-family HTH domain
MGRSRRPAPERLAQKLYTIRQYLDLTQEQMIERLGYSKTPLYPGHISEYERGKREPPLLVVMAYARLTSVPMEVLVDDELDLPERVTVTALLGSEGYERDKKRHEEFKHHLKEFRRQNEPKSPRKKKSKEPS